MANFPNSVTSFPTRSAGQTITASFFNDPQDEIAAIEDGYLNGTARLNSSNSTVANLSVTGGSTFATLSITGGSTFGALSVTGNSTIAGTVAFTGQPCCACVHSSSQVISTGAEVAVTFDTELFDIGGVHSTSSNPTQFKFPTSGVYYMQGAVQFNAASAGDRYCYWRINGSSAVGTSVEDAAEGSSAFTGLQAWGVYQAASSGEYVELMVFTANAGNLNVGSGTGRGASRALVRRIA